MRAFAVTTLRVLRQDAQRRLLVSCPAVLSNSLCTRQGRSIAFTPVRRFAGQADRQEEDEDEEEETVGEPFPRYGPYFLAWKVERTKNGNWPVYAKRFQQTIDMTIVRNIRGDKEYFAANLEAFLQQNVKVVHPRDFITKKESKYIWLTGNWVYHVKRFLDFCEGKESTGESWKETSKEDFEALQVPSRERFLEEHNISVESVKDMEDLESIAAQLEGIDEQEAAEQEVVEEEK